MSQIEINDTPDTSIQKNKKNAFFSFIRDTVIALALGIFLFLVFQFFFQFYTVDGPSMNETLADGQRMLVLKTTKQPSRGDVIIFHTPPASGVDEIFVKRVIGLPGDVIEIKNGVVFVNNEPLQEDYIINNPKINMEAVVVKDKEYFVLGDNRLVSYDSHNFGCVPQENIIGKALFVVWPTSGWGNKINYSYSF